MGESAKTLLSAVREELAPAENNNQLVEMIERGHAARSVFATIAAQERSIVTSDWRSFLTLASRASDPTARELFSGLAQGEGVALTKLSALAEATRGESAHEEPLAGCQAYPAYLAWLALNGESADVTIAILANFAAWGDYCGRIARAMRERYGFDEQACGFFDFFAEPVPGIVEQADAVVRAETEAGRHNAETSRTYARLFQTYELMFWNTLAEQAA